jgi:hypothetical protein
MNGESQAKKTQKLLIFYFFNHGRACSAEAMRKRSVPL